MLQTNLPTDAYLVYNKLCTGEFVCSGGVCTRMFAMLAKWFALTRLETRTKESSVYASIWVANPNAQ